MQTLSSKHCNFLLQGRWEESVRLLDFKLKGLVGNTLVSAGMVAYVGPFTSGYRQELAADWLARCHEKAIPISDDYEFVRNLVDANQVCVCVCVCVSVCVCVCV